MSEQDDIAKDLGAFMRDSEEDIDPRLERYARGTLSQEEKAELEREADKDENLAKALLLYAPLSAQLKRKVIAQAKPQTRYLQAAALLALAASLLAAFLLTRPPVKSLPRYQIEAKIQQVTWRGDQNLGTKKVSPDQKLSIVLRPEIGAQRVKGQLWVLTENTAQQSEALPQVSEDGALRWEGTLGALSQNQLGNIFLLAIVGIDLPSPQIARNKLKGDGWQAFMLPLVVQTARP